MDSQATRRTTRNLRIFHCNVQGLRNKFTEVKNLISKTNPHVIVLNECKVDFEKQKFNINGYDKLYDMRKVHLGTAVYIKKGLRWSQIEVIPGHNNNERVIEGVAIKLTTNFESGESIIVRGLYIPITRYRNIRGELEDIVESSDSINIGDLNLQMVQLNHNRTVGAGLEVQKRIDDELCTLKHTGLPSRPCHAGNGILDAALITGEARYSNVYCKHLESISSDHLPWLFCMDIAMEEEEDEIRSLRELYENEDLAKQYINLIENSIDPNLQIESNDDCDSYIENLESTINSALDIVAPKKKQNKKELLPSAIQQMIVDRNIAKVNVKRTGGHIQAKISYNIAKNDLQAALQNYRESTWTKIIENTKDNRAKMWKIQRSMKKPPQRLPHLDSCNTEKETIDKLVDTAIVKQSPIQKIDEGNELNTPYQPLKETDMLEVKKAIFCFKNKKAPGPDHIKVDALKLAGPAFYCALTRVINYVLKTGYYPQRWKLGECIFLHKAGKNYKEAKSYRPITLLNIMGKVCERILYTRILEECKHLIPDYQHGFMRHRGTGTQILRTSKYICDALEEGHSVAMISTDLSKAFDSINHRGLTSKLVGKDIANNVIKIIENYLMNRKIRGRFRTTIGEEVQVPHGVPQGSILGPLIFNLYVHDIPTTNIAGQMLSQYADDLCILNTAIRPDQATRRAKWATEQIIDYYERWGLQCNVDKTECIMFTKKRVRSIRNPNGYKPTVKLKGTTLEYKDCVRYLGVQMDKRLSMNAHVKHVVKKAKSVRGMLAPIIGYYSKTNVETKLAVIHSCLLPILDYGIVQLLPRVSKTNLLTIERQYRMALKSAGGFPRSIPTEMLWDLLDEDPWHLRVHDLHRDMIDKLKTMCIPGLETADLQYAKYGQYNPMMYSQRIGEIEYVIKKQRGKCVSKRNVPPREHFLI